MALLHHLLLLSILLPFCTAATDSIGQYCANSFNGSKIQANIDHVLSDLVAKASVGGFATSYSGEGSDVIYGLAQCRRDVSSDDCSTCLTAAAKKLPTVCPGQADARIWYDYCFMRYDNENFIGKADTGYAIILINVQNATDPEAFDKEEESLMSRLKAEAVAPGSKGFATGKTEFTPDVTIYGLEQCTKDLQPLMCAQCLSSALAKFPDYCRFRRGCQVLSSSCIVRYEIYPFFFPLDLRPTTEVGHYSKAILYP
ncbi:cysteine-rich repeat secretory protein 55-like [Phoenix dactylifera]|uniref:Cysteine-rich repeat secretory protein 55-like n=1 Tax=Phoenix dactylifera TaxID=42345 RepID=A0A8B7BSU9_PHODC|nr:cysteine-rich repeat secretory protein 55-like [Phoenix dactylifera]